MTSVFSLHRLEPASVYWTWVFWALRLNPTLRKFSKWWNSEWTSCEPRVSEVRHGSHWVSRLIPTLKEIFKLWSFKRGLHVNPVSLKLERVSLSSASQSLNAVLRWILCLSFNTWQFSGCWLLCYPFCSAILLKPYVQEVSFWTYWWGRSQPHVRALEDCSSLCPEVKGASK